MDCQDAQKEVVFESLHGLSADDWCPGGCYDAAVTIRAARNPDPAILRTILQHGDPYYTKARDDSSWYLATENEYGPNAMNPPDLPGYTSALLQAIISQYPENVNVLLNAGANSNGIPHILLSQNAAGFLRCGPHFAEHQSYMMEDLSIFNRTYLMRYIAVPQLASLTQQEVDDRLECPIPSRFWSEIDFRTLSPVENADRIPALVAAAENPDLTILESLLQAPSLDTSFWTATSQPPNIPNPATPSSLSISTPLHAAIWGRNLPALLLLLSYGFNPNALPLVAPTRCITPAMATVVCCYPWNAEAYKALIAHPLTDLRIRTPIYDVSLTHFAVARLDLHLLKTVTADVPVNAAGKTALGHTVLHIACLPLDESWVQMHSGPIFTSCRETRNLSELDDATEGAGDYVKSRKVLMDRRLSPPTFHGSRFGSENRPSRFLSRPSKEAIRRYHERQVHVVRYLLEICKTLDIAATDIHGNTALHYIASHREINEELLDILWNEERAEEAWRATKNRYGFTAAELFRSGFDVVEEDKEFWCVVDQWQQRKSKDKDIWEAKFRAASDAVVQGALGYERP